MYLYVDCRHSFVMRSGDFSDHRCNGSMATNVDKHHVSFFWLIYESLAYLLT